MTLILALTTWSGTAEAAGFQAKTMRAPLAAVEVERPLIIGKGWLELGVGLDWKSVGSCWPSTETCLAETGAWTNNGTVEIGRAHV